MATNLLNEGCNLGDNILFERLLNNGLKQLYKGNLCFAKSIFENIRKKAINISDHAIERCASIYLNVIESRVSDSKIILNDETIEIMIQILLNQRCGEYALLLLDKAINRSPEDVALYYLRAIAYAQLYHPGLAFDDLLKCVRADKSFFYRFRLESDFDGIRDSDLYVQFLLNLREILPDI